MSGRYTDFTFHTGSVFTLKECVEIKEPTLFNRKKKGGMELSTIKLVINGFPGFNKD